MKHQTPDEMKFKKFQRRLGVSKVIAVGTLELFWIATQKNAPQGDIGKYTDEEIAIECDWEGDPSDLIEALLHGPWITKCEVHRLVVHDWEEHAPGWIKRQLARHKKSFVTVSSGQTVTDDHRGEPDDCLDATPKERKGKETQGNPKEGNPLPKSVSAFDAWWESAHLKKGKQTAKTAYAGAVRRLGFEQPDIDPHEFLLDRMKAFAASPEAKPPDRTPIHPTTWLNSGRYDDDPETWKEQRNGSKHVIGPGQRYDPGADSTEQPRIGF